MIRARAIISLDRSIDQHPMESVSIVRSRVSLALRNSANCFVNDIICERQFIATLETRMETVRNKRNTTKSIRGQIANAWPRANRHRRAHLFRWIITEKHLVCINFSIIGLFYSFRTPVMTDDVSTAYICIYCPFNSDNLEALEHHLTSKNRSFVPVWSILSVCAILQVRMGTDVRTHHKPYRHHCHRVVFFTKAASAKLLTTNRYEIHFDGVPLLSFTHHPSRSSFNPNRSIFDQQEVLPSISARLLADLASASARDRSD